MRLVMCFSDGDGCTYSCDVVHPIEYSSAEQAIVDFEQLCIEAKAAVDAASRARQAAWTPNAGMFYFAGHEFHYGTFYSRKDTFFPPEFLTVDEWFQKYAVTTS